MSTEEDVFLTPEAFWEMTLRKKVEDSLARKYSPQDRPEPEDTVANVSVSVVFFSECSAGGGRVVGRDFFVGDGVSRPCSCSSRDLIPQLCEELTCGDTGCLTRHGELLFGKEPVDRIGGSFALGKCRFSFGIAVC